MKIIPEWFILYSLEETDGKEGVEIIKAICLQVCRQRGRQVVVRGWDRGSVWLAKDGGAFRTRAVQGHRAGGLGNGLRGEVVARFCKEKRKVRSHPVVTMMIILFVYLHPKHCGTKLLKAIFHYSWLCFLDQTINQENKIIIVSCNRKTVVVSDVIIS